MTGRKGEVANEKFQLTIPGAKMINTIISLLFIIFYFYIYGKSSISILRIYQAK